jgi:large subunit ribosomal protein L37Ae
MKSMTSGRWGARYGKRIREEFVAAEKKSGAKYLCPSCSRKKVRREAAGVWKCSHCSTKFASTAYEFRG